MKVVFKFGSCCLKLTLAGFVKRGSTIPSTSASAQAAWEA